MCNGSKLPAAYSSLSENIAANFPWPSETWLALQLSGYGSVRS